jgi:hypothetical protein
MRNEAGLITNKRIFTSEEIEIPKATITAAITGSIHTQTKFNDDRRLP